MVQDQYLPEVLVRRDDPHGRAESRAVLIPPRDPDDVEKWIGAAWSSLNGSPPVDLRVFMDTRAEGVDIVSAIGAAAEAGPDPHVSAWYVPDLPQPVLADLMAREIPSDAMVFVSTEAPSHLRRGAEFVAGLGLGTIVVHNDAGIVSTPPLAPDVHWCLRVVDAAREHAATRPTALPRPNSDESWVLIPDGEGMRESALLPLLEATAARPDAASYPAVAELLESRGEDGAAAELRRLVNHWLDQRLWSLNLVPELVVHDDRHVARVDRLVRHLAQAVPSVNGPTTDGMSLSPRDLMLLSCAAWLHDWGHVGVPLNGQFADHPADVRHLHGLLSQALLAPEYSAMHGLRDATTARCVGVLCAHHQGWTSFGKDKPNKKVSIAAEFGTVDVHPPTLAAEAEDVGGSLAQFQLLVALLRVADAADVGQHRVPDISARDGFLRSCLQRQAERLAATLRATGRPGVETAEKFSLRPDKQELFWALEQLAPDQPLVERFVRYVGFVSQQAEHYRLHSMVRGVGFAVSGGAFQALVTAAEGVDPDVAADQVSKFINVELRRPASDGDPTVRDVLERAGLTYAGAVQASG